MTKFLKFVPALLLPVGIWSASYGKSVDENTARMIGAHYLISVGAPGVQSEADLVTDYVATAKVRGATINDFYVFNISSEKGFIMVAGDDIVTPVLAYSTESSFDIYDISPAAKRWIEGYQNEITYVVQHKIAAQPGVAEEWSNLMSPVKLTGAKTTVVTPLLTTKWDQAPWYNYLCPGAGVNKAVTGCVATAMAQVMKFWNWPTRGNLTHSYTSKTMSYNLTANYGNTTYNWAGMPNTISSNNNAIGTLMLHAGIGVDMDYTSSASGSFVISLEAYRSINCAEFALKSYFNYKPTMRGVPRSGDGQPIGEPAAMTKTDWINMLEAELTAGRPVIYSGSSTTAGGHCWVCDGFDATNKMHFNWGWSGTGPDGYYSVDAIAPPVLGTGGGGGNFNNDQCAIVGIQPDSFPSATGNIKMLSNISSPNSSPIAYYAGFSVTAKIQNTNTTAFHGDICAQVFDMSGNLIATLGTLTAQTINAGDSTALLSFSTTGLYQMVPDVYAIRVMTRTSSTAAWAAVANNGTFTNYTRLGVGNFNSSLLLFDSIAVSGGSHTIIKGGALSLTTSVANFGTAPFGGTIQGTLINVATGAPYVIKNFTGEAIYSGSYVNYTFNTSSVTAPAGQYVLAVQHQPNGTGPMFNTGSNMYMNPVPFTIKPPVSIITPLMDNDVAIYPNPAVDMINVDLNGHTADLVRIFDLQGHQVITQAIDATQTAFTLSVNNIAAGMYFVQLQSGADVVTKKIVINK